MRQSTKHRKVTRDVPFCIFSHHNIIIAISIIVCVGKPKHRHDKTWRTSRVWKFSLIFILPPKHVRTRSRAFWLARWICDKWSTCTSNDWCKFFGPTISADWRQVCKKCENVWRASYWEEPAFGSEKEEYCHRVKLDVSSPTTEKDKMTSRSHKEKKDGSSAREGTAQYPNKRFIHRERVDWYEVDAVSLYAAARW